MCVNKNDVKALVGVRTVEIEVYYLPFLYVRMSRAYSTVTAKRCEVKSVFIRSLKCHENVLAIFFFLDGLQSHFIYEMECEERL